VCTAPVHRYSTIPQASEEATEQRLSYQSCLQWEETYVSPRCPPELLHDVKGLCHPDSSRSWMDRANTGWCCPQPNTTASTTAPAVVMPDTTAAVPLDDKRDKPNGAEADPSQGEESSGSQSNVPIIAGSVGGAVVVVLALAYCFKSYCQAQQGQQGQKEDVQTPAPNVQPPAPNEMEGEETHGNIVLPGNNRNSTRGGPTNWAMAGMAGQQEEL